MGVRRNGDKGMKDKKKMKEMSRRGRKRNDNRTDK